MWRVISSKPRCWQLAKPCASSTSQARCVGTPLNLWYVFIICYDLVWYVRHLDIISVIICYNSVIMCYHLLWYVLKSDDVLVMCYILYVIMCYDICYAMWWTSKYSCVMICYEISLRMSVSFGEPMAWGMCPIHPMFFGMGLGHVLTAAHVVGCISSKHATIQVL